MKKFMLFFGAAATMAAVSCSKKTDNVSYTDEEKILGDSVALLLGQNFGNDARTENDHLLQTQPDFARGFEQDEYIRGVEMVLDIDTANIAYLKGIHDAMDIYVSTQRLCKQYNIPVDPDKVAKSFKEAYNNDSIDIDKLYTEIGAISDRLNEIKRMRDTEVRAKAIAENTEKGKQYVDSLLAQGYQKTESGLVYKIVKPGTDQRATFDNKLQVAYAGKHIDGSEFDSSNGMPVPMSLYNVVPGFAEALQLIGNDGEIIAVLPSDLAYGPTGSGSVIAPGETLVFEIKIMDID